MSRSSDRRRGGLDAWPGYVDALSTLLMVIIFVLLVFVLAQGFLSLALSNRDRALDRLNRQIAELAEMLALERGQAEEIRASLGRASEELTATTAARDAALRQLGLLREERAQIGAERDTARAERERLAARLADLELAARGGAERIAALERQLTEALTRAEAVGGDAARTVRDLTDTRRTLTAERAAREQLARERAALDQQYRAARASLEQTQRDLEAMRREAAALDRQVQADRATIEARLSDIARLSAQVRALTALRDQLERQAQAAMARAGAAETSAEAAARRAAEAEAARRAADLAAAEAARARGTAETAAERSAREAAEAATARRTAEAAAAEAERRARAAEASATTRTGTAEERARRAEEQAQEYARLGESARAQVALLTQQMTALRAELQRVAAALDIAEEQGRDREAQIALLGQRLNAALAARVEELQRYRSDFFGRLRAVLGDRPEVRIVGDRFVFQSEVLFPAASAELSERGQQQMRDLAQVLLQITAQIPPDIAWVMRVDGHADRNPIRTARFASNWELAAARAIAVAQLLIVEGLPANRVAATSFGDTQPLDPGDGLAALARNRRIELRLTDR